MKSQINKTLTDKVKATIKRYGLIGAKDKIVVGVSGGPDSVALLYALNNLKKELNFDIHIAHLDHMMRPDSSKDRAFVERLAMKLKLPVTSASINIKELSKRGSIEEIARNARLGFLFKVAKEVKAKSTALGHNLDDQAETVLMRILRGTGLYGLSAILPKRKISGFQVIRPLIEVKRKEIESFLRKKNIRAITDKTNLEDVYFRNKIRHNLLPLLEKKYNNNIKEVLSNMAESVGYDYDYLSRAAERAIKQLTPRISLKKISRLHPSIQRLVFRLNIARLKGDMRRISLSHIREIDNLICWRPVNSIVDLPKGVSVIKKKKYLSFFRR